LFQVTAAGNLSLLNLTLSNGLAQGGAGAGSGGGAAGLGGAVYNQGGTVNLINSTLTGNTARGGNSSGNSQQGDPGGGGCFNLNGTLTLTNVILAANTVALGTGGLTWCASGGALYNASVNVGADTAGPTATVTVANSILANTTGGLVDVINYQGNGP